MSGEDGHTFTSADLMKALRDYAVCEQEDGYAVGFIRNSRYGRGRAGNPLVAGGVPQKAFFMKCVSGLVFGQTH